MASREEEEFYQGARCCARFHARMFGLAADAVEDCAQAFVVKLLLTQHDPPVWAWQTGRREGYLRSAARHHASNFVRNVAYQRAGPLESATSGDGLPHRSEDASINPDMPLFRSLFWDQIHDALQGLTPLQRKLVVCYHVRESTVAELARALGCNSHAVHGLLSHARKRLQAHLVASGNTETELRSYLSTAHVTAVCAVRSPAAYPISKQGPPRSLGANGSMSMVEATSFKARLVSVALEQFDRYHLCVASDEPLKSRIATYWADVGFEVGRGGASWSGVFVSWCVKQAGATEDQFVLSLYDSTFVQAAIRNADEESGVFRGRDPAGYAPRVGDIVQSNRKDRLYDFEYARANSEYESHSAIVVKVVRESIHPYVVAVGGDENGTVGERRVPLGPAGLISNDDGRYICVIETLK